MGRKSRHKKQRDHTPLPSNVILTFAAARMLRDALRLVDEALARTTKPLPNLALGAETLGNIKRKLDDMLQGEDWEKETPFDYNETHILYAAVQMYLVNLALTGNQRLVSMCLQLCEHFTTVIESVPPKQLNAPRND